MRATATLQGYLAAAAAPTLVGLGVAASSYLVGYPALASQGARYLLGALLLLAVFRGRVLPAHGLCAGDWARLALLSAVGLGLFSVASIEALRHASVAGVGVIIGCVPIVLALVGSAMEHRRLGPAFLLAAAVAVAGSVLVNGFGRLDPVGLAWALVAMASDASFSLLSAKLVPRLGVLPVAFCSTLLAGLVMTAVGYGLEPRVPTAPEVAAILYLAITVSAGAFVLWYVGLARLGVVAAGLFVALIPVGSLLGALVVQSRSVSLVAVAGVVLVALGIALGQRSAGKRDDRLDLDRRAKRQGGDPDGRARVAPSLSEDLDEQLGGRVHHRGLREKARGRGDEPGQLDPPADACETP
jgi:drug/metabolite transporter (DMT)-like permease